MTNKLWLRPHWSNLLALAFGWLCVASAGFAQTATGTIQGRVYNPVSKEYVRNAEVRLQGSQQVIYTENDGSFRFENVPAGTTEINVTYTGYNPAKESFTVTAGQIATREINLTSTAANTNKDGVLQLSAFTVSSEREGNAKAIQAQRRDMNVITSVSSDIFGDVADGNVGEFLKYLPGIDLDYVESEPRGPRLGGMDGQYVGVAFDGMRTANADANRGGDGASRATSFEGFSITSIESIEVNWTNSPENDGDTPAGNVNMRTKRAFDRKGRQFTYNLSASFNTEEFLLGRSDGPRDKESRKWQPNYIMSYAESFLNQKVGILLSASHSYSYTEQIVANMGYNRTANANDPRPMVIRQIDFKDGPKFIVKDSLLLTADWKVTPRLTLSMNATYSYFEGEFWNRNFTFVAANDNSNATVANGRTSVGGDGISTIIATRVAAGSTPTSQTNTVAQLNNGGGGASKLTYSRQYAPRFEYRLGSLVVDGAFAFSKSKNNYEAIERGFSSNEGGSIPASFIATRSGPRAWEWNIRQTSGLDWTNLANWTGGTRVTNDDRTWITEKWTGTANARYSLPFMERFPTTVKVGGKWDEETRKNKDHNAWSSWSYIGPGGNTATYNPATEVWTAQTVGNWANLGPQFTSANPFELGKTNAWAGGGVTNINGVLGRPARASRNAMAELFTSRPDLFVNTTNVENYYTSWIANDKNIRQTITGGYGQADTRLSRKLQLRFGVRWEETKTDATEWDPLSAKQMFESSPFRSQFTRNATTGIVTPARATSISGIDYQYKSQGRITRTGKYDDFFPSVSLKYNILPNFEWQAGFNRSIGRPSINSLAGLWVVDEQNQRVTAPNPELQPERHKKYLTRLAYYFQGRSPGSLTATVSKTEFTNTLASFNYSSAEFGNEDPDFETYIFVSNRNISDRITTTKNMSLSYRQTMGFLPTEYLRSITFFINYDRTYLTASGDGRGAAIRRSNVTPHRISSGISHRFRKLNTSFNMIWADDRPESGTYGQYFSELTKYDCSIGYEFNRRLSLFVQGRNITNVKDRWMISPVGVEEGEQGHLRQMEAYGANWAVGIKGTF
jgi:iron complex outermembrane receptor protein